MSSQVVLVQASPSSKIGFQCYGAAAELWRYKGPEAVISGPFETGKTLASLQKVHAYLAKYPGARGLLVRKTYKSLIGSAIVTYERKVLPIPIDDPRCPVGKYGGEKPEWYDYPNGARLVIGGMDNPDKFLSAEYDIILVIQAEELSLDEWEKLTGRATGRAGNAPYAQVIGDCNPGPAHHWIKHRSRIKLLESRHEDNPTLFDPVTKQITEQGKRTMETLDALTGVRRERGRFGRWVSAEGVVYDEWDPALHVIDRFDIPPEWKRYRTVDFGLTNPFCCQWWACDHDGRLYLYREIYETGLLVEDAARDIVELSTGERVLATITDHDAEDRATLHRHKVPTVPAKKLIKPGIQLVKKRLAKAADGKPRLFVMRDSLVRVDESLRVARRPCNTEQEFDAYVWPKGLDDKPQKEIPVDDNNHGMDPTRYMVAHLDFGGTWTRGMGQ